MAEALTRPGAAGKFTRGKLGEKLYLQSYGFNLWDPNCYVLRPTYHSLHDPYLKQHFLRKDIHNNLKKRNLINDDDMVICTQREYNVYHDYKEDIKNDFKIKLLRERQRKILELREQGLISEDVPLEDIRTFLQMNKLPRHSEHQQLELGQPKRSTKKTMKEKDVTLNERRFTNIPMQPTCKQDRTHLRLIEQQIKHEFNRNKRLREIQEKRSQREKIILAHRDVIQQTEMNKLMKTLRDLDKKRVIKKDQTKPLNRIFCESTSAKVPLKKPMQRRPTVKRLPPLPPRGQDLSDQRTSSSDTKLSQPSDTANPKLPFLGKVKLPANQHDPVANKNARITQTVLDNTISTATQSQSESVVEAISSPTVNREDTAGETLNYGKSFGFASKTKNIGAKISSDIYPPTMAFAGASCFSRNVSVFWSKEEYGFVSLKEPEASSPHMSSDEVETLAGVSSAPFVSSSEKSVWSPAMLGQLHSAQSSQPKGTQLCMDSVAPDSPCSDASRVSGKEVSPNEIALPADGSTDLSGVPSSPSNVFKTEEHQPVTLQEVTLESSSSKPEILLERWFIKDLLNHVSSELSASVARQCISPRSLKTASTSSVSDDDDNDTLGRLNAVASELNVINHIPTLKNVGQWISLSKLDFLSTCLTTSVIDNVYYSDSSTKTSSTASPELEANSPVLECLMSLSKPASPTNNRSFRARKCLSLSALDKSANTKPVSVVHSKIVECLPRTDLQSKNKVQLESSSNGTMSTSSTAASLEEKRSLVCSPLPNRLRSSRTLTNLRDKMQMDSTLRPKPPCKKSNQSFQQLPDETTKTSGRRKVKISTIYWNPEGLSDDESSCTSCPAPEDIQSDASEEGPSLSPHKRHSI